MDFDTINVLNECIMLNSRIIRKLKTDAEEAETSIKGQLLEVYREALTEAVQRASRIENQLNAIKREP